MLESKVQLGPPTKQVIMVVLTPKSVIQLTAFIAFEIGRRLNYACYNFSHQSLISAAQKRSFPSLMSNNSHTMHRFIIFMRISQDDGDIDCKCYVKNLLRFFNKHIARERIDKIFIEFCYFGLLKIVIILQWNEIAKDNLAFSFISFIWIEVLFCTTIPHANW